MDCNADLGHPCDANDGEPCDACVAYEREMEAECRTEYNAASMIERVALFDPELAREMYRDEMRDAGRGHLLRDEDYERQEALRRFDRAESILPQHRGPRQ